MAVAMSWPFVLDHLIVILGELPARRLLNISCVSRLWHAAVGDILRARASAEMAWRSNIFIEGMVDENDDLLRTSILDATSAWQHLPTLAMIFATDAAFEVYHRKGRKSRANVTEASRRLADEAGEYLPPFCTVIVVRATGVLGCSTGGRDMPREVEDGEDQAAISMLLAHTPSSVELSWLGVGRDDGATPSKAKGMPSVKTCTSGKVASHAGAWWLPPARRDLAHTVEEVDCSQLSDSALEEHTRAWAPDLSHVTGKRLIAIETGGESYEAASPLFQIALPRLTPEWVLDCAAPRQVKTAPRSRTSRRAGPVQSSRSSLGAPSWPSAGWQSPPPSALASTREGTPHP